ncbi:penicillin acylase family protein [Bacillus thuringiensis]|uniref:penicillin acylase family protein n=1 Tax=Bacillus thuringiensis TaxID=1428 RepID=UPI00159681E9|nr:penicillin acylase family protein [Bacillus thuringiensis]
MGNSWGIVPAIGPVLNPLSVIWKEGEHDKKLPSNERRIFEGLNQKVSVLFESNGTPHIQAKTDEDMWKAIGYVQAKFRLHQMDLMRRQGRGEMAEIVGSTALESDQFQRQLGLSQTAEVEWENMQPNSEVRRMLIAYADGVNHYIQAASNKDELPLMFKLWGYKPKPWQPQDSLVVKGVLNQMLSFSTLPVKYALWSNSLGYENTMKLFPVQSPLEQYSYTSGPYENMAINPMPFSATQVIKGISEHDKRLEKETTAVVETNIVEMGKMAEGFLQKMAALPPQAVHEDSNSNAWVVDGTKTASGKPLLAGDPHLGQTLPSIWYEMEVSSPNYSFSGVSVPGIPLVLIGKNQQISWSLTNGQNQQTFYYIEKTSSKHPNKYFWEGKWHNIHNEEQIIKVKGVGEVPFQVKSTVHGPIIERDGLTLSVNWVGAIPSRSIEGLLGVVKSKNFAEFDQSLEKWTSPTMNWIYADSKGNIGLVGAGYYPIVDSLARPWMPMDGTGKGDIKGTISYTNIPRVYNPPNHMIVTANQRQVGPDFPYYIGTSMYFDFGTRAQRIEELLQKGKEFKLEDFKKIQMDVVDPLALTIKPYLLKALEGNKLNETEKKALSVLTSWGGEMDANSSGATIWWYFWEKYVNETFQPWWDMKEVPAFKGVEPIGVTAKYPSLAQNLVDWTLHAPNQEFFNNPITKEKRTASVVMVKAFKEAVSSINKQLGEDVSKWNWGDLHKRNFLSPTGIPALGYASRGDGGNQHTINVGPSLISKHGPTWRTIYDWGDNTAIGIYPGGQSENPLSPWYKDRIDDWWSGTYKTFKSYHEVEKESSSIRWTLINEHDRKGD